MSFDFYLLLKLTRSRSRNFDIPAPAAAPCGSGSTTLQLIGNEYIFAAAGCTHFLADIKPQDIIDPTKYH
jgi:hypothetical protein